MKPFSSEARLNDYNWLWHRLLLVPHTYVNSEVLCLGEVIKILAYTPLLWREKLQLKIKRVSDEGGEDLEVQQYDFRSMGTPRSHVQIDSKELSPASYVAQVASGRSFEEILDEHAFHVFDTPDYDEYWRTLYGETWDEPIYLDSLSEDGFALLLRGRPTPSLLDNRTDARQPVEERIINLLGPSLTYLMLDEHGRLPFSVMCSSGCYKSLAQPPHIDLTKVFWALSALTPVFFDMAFYSSKATIFVDLYADVLIITFRVDRGWDDGPRDDTKRNAPRLFDLVERKAGGKKVAQPDFFDMTWGKNELKLIFNETPPDRDSGTRIPEPPPYDRSSYGESVPAEQAETVSTEALGRLIRKEA